MKRISNIIRLSITGIIALYLIYAVYYASVNPMHPVYEDCGVILSKSNDEVAIKHGTKTELYLNVQFNKSGFKSMEVEPTTYFKHNVNETICFDLHEKTSNFHKINSLTGWVVMMIVGVLAVAAFVYYLVEGKFLFKGIKF